MTRMKGWGLPLRTSWAEIITALAVMGIIADILHRLVPFHASATRPSRLRGAAPRQQRLRLRREMHPHAGPRPQTAEAMKPANGREHPAGCRILHRLALVVGKRRVLVLERRTTTGRSGSLHPHAHGQHHQAGYDPCGRLERARRPTTAGRSGNEPHVRPEPARGRRGAPPGATPPPPPVHGGPACPTGAARSAPDEARGRRRGRLRVERPRGRVGRLHAGAPACPSAAWDLR
jgi:hypothetical protein